MVCFHALRNKKKHRHVTFLFTLVFVVVCVFGLAHFGNQETPLVSRHLLAEEASGGFSFLEALDGPTCSAHFPHFLAIIIWIAFVLYAFLAIAIVCDDFFVASLEVISEVLNLSDDVAGATFMAAGSSAPELFTAVTGVFFVKDIANDNPGVGTIVGSAVFNIAVIIGASVLCVGSTLELDWWPLARDGVCYSISIFLLILSFVGITPGRIDWWEGLVFIIFYALYITLMKYNQRIVDYLETREGKNVNRISENTVEVAEPVDIEGQKDTVPLGGGGGKRNRRESSLVILQYQSRLHISKMVAAKENATTSEPPSTPSFKAGAIALIAVQRMKLLVEQRERAKNFEQFTDVDVNANGSSSQDTARLQTVDTDESEKKSWMEKILLILSWPLVKMFAITIPDCSQEKWRKWFAVSFGVSVLWIAIISYVMVEFAIKLGRCFHLSTNIMGLTVLAAGTSVPDCLSSMMVAKQGKGNMAVSNAIGSNVFDILLGLGLPWLLSGLLKGKPLPIDSTGIVLYIFIMYGVLLTFLFSVKFSGWKLKVWHGYLLISLEVAFCVFAVFSDYLFAK